VGNLEEARRGLRIRAEHLPGHWRNPTWEAEVAYAEGDRAEVRRIYGSALEDASVPRHEEWYRYLLGSLDLLEGRPSLGEEFVAPDLLGKARIETYVRLRPDEARSLIEEALEDATYTDSDTWIYLTHAFFWALAGRATEARAALDRWRAVMPEGPRRNTRDLELNVQGWIALAEGSTEDGLDLFRQASAAGHGLPDLEGDLAVAYDQAQMPDSALAAYHRYLDAPNWGRLSVSGSLDRYYLARTYERLGQLHEARGELDEAATYHALFVDLWADADPDLQPRVQAAREALERIEGRL
jgi:tetratricopeptide (TPR) repeat protein